MDAFNQILAEIARDQNGLEIGGPSPTGTILYDHSRQIDNVIFSSETVWSTHKSGVFVYPNPNDRLGQLYLCDATDLSKIPGETYDFVFASHCLEHIANPLKALCQWRRVIRDNGHIVLILPEKSVCFDHLRDYAEFSTLLGQYDKIVGEDDLSTLPEIIAKHDISRDGGARNPEYFYTRSLDNYNNRCLHHYVYSVPLLHKIADWLNCECISTITNGLDIWFIMKKTRPPFNTPS